MKKITFQAEILQAFRKNKDGELIIEISLNDLVKTMLMTQLEIDGFINETSKILRKRVKQNMANVIKLAYDNNTPIIPKRNMETGRIKFYKMYRLIKLSEIERKIMEDDAFDEIDYTKRNEEISHGTKLRYANKCISKGILSLNHPRFKELDEDIQLELGI